MGLTVRQVIDSLATHGIMSASDVQALREKVQAEIENDADPLLRDLVRANKLTKFQAANLYAGRAKGLVFGEYLILDKIGAGGMGQVYKAQHRKMKRVVALKVLPPQLLGSPKAVQRFYQEVEVAAQLTHPNIVTAYDAGEAHGMLYLVMEFVDGKDLSSHVSKHGPLSLEQTLNVVLQAARGLAYAHGLGIIHRDVKPSNLLVGRDKTVKILDMGLARAANPIGETGPVGAELTASGEVMGTVDYMSPEQATDTRTADHRADIYALGCTLYRLYLGKPPYSGETAVQKILAHRDKPIPSLQAERPETPDMVERLYKKMLAKNVTERTQTMAAVVKSIEQMLAGVDEDKSSVMLGNEPPPDGDDFMPSGAIVGGSSLGNLPGSSQIQKNKPMGSSIGGDLPAMQPNRAQVAVSTKQMTSKRIGDTDAGGATKPVTSAATAAKSAAPAGKQNRTVLIAGGAGAALLVVGAIAFFALGGKKGEPPIAPGAAVAAVATPTSAAPKPTPSAQPVASAPVAAPSPTVAVVASLPVPVPGASPSPTANMFQLPTTPSVNDSPSTTPPPPPPAFVPAPQAVVPTKQEELTGEIDLLAMIDVARHTRRGGWQRRSSEVVLEGSGGASNHYLDVPYAPPEEYDLTCVAVPTNVNMTFGFGFVLGGSSCDVLANDDKLGLEMIDGRTCFDSVNPTFRQGPYFTVNSPVTLVCAVRRNRIAVALNGKRLIDQELTANRLTAAESAMVHPGQLSLRSALGIRYTALKIGPPQLPMTPPSAAVNLAAAFEQTDVAEGTASQRRGEVLLSAQPGTWVKLQFNKPHGEAYVVRAVVERSPASGAFILNLPCGSRRIGAAVDFHNDRFVGLQNTGPGGVEKNPTGRKDGGLLLTPGELHIVEFRAVPAGNGYHFDVTIDGRKWVDYATDNFGYDGGTDVPDKSAVGLGLWGGNLRILRLDQFSADGRRQPVPNSTDRATAAEAVRALASQADAKGAPLDAKLLAVDLLRKKAATELNDDALRYEALDAAIRIAAAAGDLAGCYEAIEDMAIAFDIDARGFHPKLLETFKSPRTATAAKQQFIDEALKLTVRAARSEQFELALDLNAAIDKFPGATNADLKRELKARATEYEFAQSLQGPAVEARKKLESDPKDAAAHTALGLYYAAGLGDWGRAVKELAQGNDAGLQSVALLEQNDAPLGDAKFAVAEKWLELSDKEKSNPLKWTYAERASYWYRRAASNISDAKRPLLGRQLGKIAQLRKASNGAGGPRRPLDAVKIGDHWYQVIPIDMHWDSAAATCENMGGHMIVLDNAAESQAVAQLVMQRLASTGTEKAFVWLGANDADKEGFFRRLDGVPLAPPAYVNWSGNEPNNAGGDEDYVCWDINYSSGQISTSWRDGARTFNQMTVVCEWDH